jgi:DedD protein
MGKPETVTSEEMDLRRRARRRLVGAVALALLAVTVLPLLFSREPRPLGSDVDIRIPDPATPFTPPAPVSPYNAPSQQPMPPGKGQEVMPPQSPRPPEPKRVEHKPPVPRPEPVGEAKETEPASEGFASSGYFLQLGAFTNETNARQLAHKARLAGFDVQVESIKGQVRVRIGPYKERREALEMQSKLRAKGFGPVLLGP